MLCLMMCALLLGDCLSWCHRAQPKIQWKEEHATAAHAGLEIFVDDEFQTSSQGASKEGLSGAAGVSSSQPMWAQLGSFEQTRKENMQQAGAWAGGPWHVLLPLSWLCRQE